MASVKASENVVFTKVYEHEGVLLDLLTVKYFVLNETAMFVWEGLEREMSAQEIALRMVELYEVSYEHAKASTDQLIRDLASYELVISQSPQA